MIFLYGRCNGNAEASAREYRRKYPNRRRPSAKVFYSVYQHLLDNGCFPGVGARAERMERQNETRRILRMVHRSPSISTRRISSRLTVPQSKVWRTLKRESLYPYSVQQVQNLQPGDHVQRLNFCTWLTNNSKLCKSILFTDEATFTRDGSHNSHNTHWWSEKNPKKTTERNFQHRFSVNVWCGMIDNQLIGPHTFEGKLTGDMYLHFLQNELPSLLEDVPLKTRLRMVYQQDGAPPHYSRHVTQHLNQEFPGRWIGRGGPHPWPARSPDLTPLDFHLWGHMKSLAYKKKINSKEDLLQQIHEAAQVIKNNPAVLRKATQSVLHRARKCIVADGGHFEHQL